MTKIERPHSAKLKVSNQSARVSGGRIEHSSDSKTGQDWERLYIELKLFTVSFVSAMKLLFAFAGCMALLSLPGHAVQATAVQVPTAGISSSPAPLRAFVFRPDGNAKHPAVVMVHGCGGVYGKDGQLNARHQMWGEYLAAQGYLALMLDSFSTRGYQQICTTKFSERTLKETDRVGDVYAAGLSHRD